MYPILHHWKESKLIQIPDFIGGTPVCLHQHIIVIGEILDIKHIFLRCFASVNTKSYFEICFKEGIKLHAERFAIVIFCGTRCLRCQQINRGIVFATCIAHFKIDCQCRFAAKFKLFAQQNISHIITIKSSIALNSIAPIIFGLKQGKCCQIIDILTEKTFQRKLHAVICAGTGID